MPTQTIKAEDRHKFLVRKNLESASLGSLVGMGGAGMAKTLGATISPKMIAALGVTGAITGLTASIIRAPEAPKDNVVLNKISREELIEKVAVTLKTLGLAADRISSRFKTPIVDAVSKDFFNAYQKEPSIDPAAIVRNKIKSYLTGGYTAPDGRILVRKGLDPGIKLHELTEVMEKKKKTAPLLDKFDKVRKSAPIGIGVTTRGMTMERHNSPQLVLNDWNIAKTLKRDESIKSRLIAGVNKVIHPLTTESRTLHSKAMDAILAQQGFSKQDAGKIMSLPRLPKSVKREIISRHNSRAMDVLKAHPVSEENQLNDVLANIGRMDYKA